MWLSLQFTHHCHNYTHLVSIYALLLRFMIFCHNLRTSVAIFAILSQFTHFCRGARYSVIYAFWEPKKTVILGFRAKKTEFPAMGLRVVEVLARLSFSLDFRLLG